MASPWQIRGPGGSGFASFASGSPPGHGGCAWTPNGFTWCDVPINVQWFSTPLSASINFKCVLAYISINIYHLPFLFVVQKKSYPYFGSSCPSFGRIISLFSRCDTHMRDSLAPVHLPSKSTRPRTPMLSLPRKWTRGKVLKPTKIVDRWDDKQIAGKHCISEPISSRFP